MMNSVSCLFIFTLQHSKATSAMVTIEPASSAWFRTNLIREEAPWLEGESMTVSLPLQLQTIPTEFPNSWSFLQMVYPMTMFFMQLSMLAVRASLYSVWVSGQVSTYLNYNKSPGQTPTSYTFQHTIHLKSWLTLYRTTSVNKSEMSICMTTSSEMWWEFRLAPTITE